MPSWINYLLPLLIGAILVFAGWQTRGWYEASVTVPKLQSEIDKANADRQAAEDRERRVEAARTADGQEADIRERALYDALGAAQRHAKALNLAGDCGLPERAVRLYNDFLVAGAGTLPGPAAVVPDASKANQPAP